MLRNAHIVFTPARGYTDATIGADSLNLWAVVVEDLAAMFECDEANIGLIEDEDGNEFVTVKGEVVGTLEVS